MTVTTYGKREELVNNWIGSITSGLTAGSTTIPVGDGTGLPTFGDFRLQIGSELILCDGRTGNNVSVVARGIEGTTAASHLSGAEARAVLTAGGLEQWILDHWGHPFGDETDGAPPLNRITDETGTTLTSTDFTWLNQGSATITDDSGRLILKLPSENSDQIRGMELTPPSTPFHVYTKLHAPIGTVGTPNDGTHGGLFFRASGGRLVVLVWRNGNSLSLWRMNSTTSFSAVIDMDLEPNGHAMWLRLTDDGTDIKGAWSLDGANWSQVGSSWLEQGRLSWLPDIAAVGFYGSSGNAETDIPFVFENFVVEQF